MLLRLTKQTANSRASAPFHDNELSGSGTNYLLKFVHAFHAAPKYVIVTVISDNARAVVFEIDTTTDDPANGGLIFDDAGQYRVTCYQQTNDTNLDPNDAVVDGVAWEGGAIVEDDVSTDNVQYFAPTITDSKYHGV